MDNVHLLTTDSAEGSVRTDRSQSSRSSGSSSVTDHHDNMSCCCRSDCGSGKNSSPCGSLTSDCQRPLVVEMCDEKRQGFAQRITYNVISGSNQCQPEELRKKTVSDLDISSSSISYQDSSQKHNSQDSQRMTHACAHSDQLSTSPEPQFSENVYDFFELQEHKSHLTSVANADNISPTSCDGERRFTENRLVCNRKRSEKAECAEWIDQHMTDCRRKAPIWINLDTMTRGLGTLACKNQKYSFGSIDINRETEPLTRTGLLTESTGGRLAQMITGQKLAQSRDMIVESCQMKESCNSSQHYTMTESCWDFEKKKVKTMSERSQSRSNRDRDEFVRVRETEQRSGNMSFRSTKRGPQPIHRSGSSEEKSTKERNGSSSQSLDIGQSATSESNLDQSSVQPFRSAVVECDSRHFERSKGSGSGMIYMKADTCAYNLKRTRHQKSNNIESAGHHGTDSVHARELESHRMTYDGAAERLQPSEVTQSAQCTFVDKQKYADVVQADTDQVGIAEESVFGILPSGISAEEYATSSEWYQNKVGVIKQSSPSPTTANNLSPASPDDPPSRGSQVLVIIPTVPTDHVIQGQSGPPQDNETTKRMSPGYKHLEAHGLSVGQENLNEYKLCVSDGSQSPEVERNTVLNVKDKQSNSQLEMSVKLNTDLGLENDSVSKTVTEEWSHRQRNVDTCIHHHNRARQIAENESFMEKRRPRPKETSPSLPRDHHRGTTDRLHVCCYDHAGHHLNDDDDEYRGHHRDSKNHGHPSHMRSHEKENEKDQEESRCVHRDTDFVRSYKGCDRNDRHVTDITDDYLDLVMPRHSYQSGYDPWTWKSFECDNVNDIQTIQTIWTPRSTRSHAAVYSDFDHPTDLDTSHMPDVVRTVFDARAEEVERGRRLIEQHSQWPDVSVTRADENKHVELQQGQETSGEVYDCSTVASDNCRHERDSLSDFNDCKSSSRARRRSGSASGRRSPTRSRMSRHRTTDRRSRWSRSPYKSSSSVRRSPSVSDDRSGRYTSHDKRRSNECEPRQYRNHRSDDRNKRSLSDRYYSRRLRYSWRRERSLSLERKHLRNNINRGTDRLPAGYCFVEFSDEEEARRAMLRLNGKIVPGSDPPTRFKLNQASFGREHLKDQEHSLFIGELSEDVDDFALYSAFHKKYNSVKAAKVVLDSEGRSRGFGFVRFSDEEEQKRALVEMNHYTGLGQKAIRVSTATAKRGGSNLYSYGSGMHQSYYPSYQNYPSQGYYGQSWWQAYQMPPQYYGYGMDYSQTQSSVTNEDEELEDPDLEVDVSKINEEFMEINEEVFHALESSRWHLLDNAMATIDDITVK